MAPEKAQEEAQVEALIALKTAFLNNRTQNDGRKHRRPRRALDQSVSVRPKNFLPVLRTALSSQQTSGDGLLSL